ncbi:MAG: hypothetical protein LH606_03165 [Cytophagaceae bacterium]|nr:hypothetical protein [Cytophagaceae bacterium]
MNGYIFISCFLLIINALTVFGQSGTRVITLRTQRNSAPPKRFSVAQVLDERSDKTTLGTLFDGTQTGPNPPRPVALTLTGGTGPAIERFLKADDSRRSDARSDPTRWEIVVRLKKVQFSEKLTTPRKIDGNLTVVLVFDVLRNGTRTKLTEFEGGSRFSRSPGILDLHEALLRQTLESALRYLDQWLALNAPVQEVLARRVRVVFQPGFSGVADKGDSVFYDSRRPLRWDDFRAPPRSGRNYGAAVFSSFGYEASAHTVGGVVEVVMSVKVYELKNQSWVWPAAKNDYALRHEQLHFDITQLVAERFKQKLQTEDLAPDEYDSRIQYLFLDSFREMNRLQQQYDDETAHSINRAAQDRWDAKITADLRLISQRNP